MNIKNSLTITDIGNFALQVREGRILQTGQKELQRRKLSSNPEKQIIKTIFGQFRNTHARYFP
jgi:hypothetical protein